jgi:predicted transcriptional regulator
MAFRNENRSNRSECTGSTRTIRQRRLPFRESDWTETRRAHGKCRQLPRSVPIALRLNPKGLTLWCRRFPYRGLPGASLTVLPPSPFSRTLKVMEVHFTPEQQAQLAQIATKAGTKPEQLVTDVVARYLDEKARFLAAVEKGIAAAERGEFIEEEEMDARLERMFQS